MFRKIDCSNKTINKIYFLYETVSLTRVRSEMYNTFVNRVTNVTWRSLELFLRHKATEKVKSGHLLFSNKIPKNSILNESLNMELWIPKWEMILYLRLYFNNQINSMNTGLIKNYLVFFHCKQFLLLIIIKIPFRILVTKG